MSLTTLAERILIEEDDDLFQCACGRADSCTWCRLHREAEAAGMRRDETPPQWARRFLGKDDPPVPVKITLSPAQRRIVAEALEEFARDQEDMAEIEKGDDKTQALEAAKLARAAHRALYADK